MVWTLSHFHGCHAGSTHAYLSLDHHPDKDCYTLSAANRHTYSDQHPHAHPHIYTHANFNQFANPHFYLYANRHTLTDCH